MRTFITLALVAGCATLFANGNSDKATAKTRVSIYAPITIVKTADLDFGAIVMDGFTGGSVDLSENSGIPTYTDCAALSGSKARQPQLAVFHVRFDKDLAWSRSATVATVDGCTYSPVDMSPLTPCVLNGTYDGKDFTDKDGTNKDHFLVGGKLTIPANTFGEKTGTLEVTVAYN